MPFEPVGQTLERPLLPYEKELVRLLGCSEEDYRKHVEQVRFQSTKRPAGYELIPDVRCDPVSIIVSVAIGAALTAVSSLLAPKPKQQKDRKQGKSIRLASRQGAERFGATTGFDSANDLANYAEPIAVIFAKRENNIGGVLASGQLVWSRAYSYGVAQGMKLLYVIGEQGLGGGMDRPDLAGIYLGTVPLDSLSENKYAFYWNRNTNENGRIKAKNWAYGTRATPDAGDPQTNDDIFLCPSGIAANDTAFSQVYTPSSNNVFGAYGAIANGTGYRVNYELVPLPRTDGESSGDERDRLSASIRRRNKISGSFRPPRNEVDLNRSRRDAQRDVGREYSRRMGLYTLNGRVIAPDGPDGHKELAAVNVGDVAVFVISGGFIPENTYWDGDKQNDVNCDDINNAVVRMREEADDALQVGQIVMIGMTVWVVTNRAVDVFGEGIIGPFASRPDQNITLKCIEKWGADPARDQVGFVSNNAIIRGIRTDDRGKKTYPYDGDWRPGLSIGPGFFPLMQVNFASVRNTRPCESTEFGIKSQVWNQANGLCNFSSLPTPQGLFNADMDGDSLNSGTMNAYFTRSSVFTVWVRPAGTDESGNDYDWAPIGEQFVIQGKRPVDQYNFLRFLHPQIREYEFKFVPKPGSDLTQFAPDEAEFILLDARMVSYAGQGANYSRPYTTPYGTFVVQGSGREILKRDIKAAPEMATGAVETTVIQPIINVPNDIIIAEYIPDIEGSDAKATAVVQVGDGWSSLPEYENPRYRQVAFFAEIFGQAKPFGATKSFEYTWNNLRPAIIGGPNRSLTLQFDGIVNQYFPASNLYFPGWRAWSLTAIRVIASSGGMNVGDTFNCRVPISGSNPRNPMGYSQVGVEIAVDRTNALSTPAGRQNAYSYEVLGSARNHSIGARVSSAPITLTGPGGKTTQVVYSAQVVKSPGPIIQAFGETQVWDYESVGPVANTTFGNWARTEFADHIISVSNDNPFRKNYTEIGIRYQVAGLRQEQQAAGFSSERVFEENAGITDLSNYTERTTSNSSSPEHEIVYVSETVKSRKFEADYDKLTTAGLAIRSGRDFTSVDQLRVWMKDGVEVRRFHPGDGGIGTSNMLPDLVYYLMTDPTAGIGDLVSDELLDLPSFTKACQFLRLNQLYFNGAISEPQNLRDYVTEIAPFFLMDFAILNGKFSFIPAIPITDGGAISTGAVPISALFSEGNIIEGSFEVEYLEADQRRDFTAAMRWRYEQVNKLPEERVVVVSWNKGNAEDYPLESFDMTDYCCSEEHAIKAAKYLLSLRRRVTHTVTFKTSPLGLNLAPGQYIKVVTQANPYQAANNGVIEADGTLIMSSDLTDNVYPIWYFDWDSTYIKEGQMTVVDGKVVEESLWDTIVTLRYPGISAEIYQVQQLTLDEDGLVEIVALEHPTDIAGVSEIAKDLRNDGEFSIGY